MGVEDDGEIVGVPAAGRDPMQQAVTSVWLTLWGWKADDDPDVVAEAARTVWNVSITAMRRR